MAKGKSPSITIVIPTLNEAGMLGKALNSLKPNERHREIIVVDGQSTDGTADIARGSGVRVLVSRRRDRGHQMNLGAAEAEGDVLLFLHADTLLPEGGLDRLSSMMEGRPGLVGGAFSRRYEDGGVFLSMTSALASLRGRATGIFLGDQGIFIRRKTFERLGGFVEGKPCEDLDLSLRMRQAGPVMLLPTKVISSARRFGKRGPVRQTFLDLLVSLKFMSGMSAQKESPESSIVCDDSNS